MSSAAPSLTPKQEQGIVALLTEPTIRHAAAKIDVHERTLHRWLDEETFGRAYRRARRLAFSQAMALTQHYAPLAIQNLARIMNDPATPAPARVAAAGLILKFSRDSIEIDDLAERVDALERGQGRPEPQLVLPPWVPKEAPPSANGHTHNDEDNVANGST